MERARRRSDRDSYLGKFTYTALTARRSAYITHVPLDTAEYALWARPVGIAARSLAWVLRNRWRQSTRTLSFITCAALAMMCASRVRLRRPAK